MEDVKANKLKRTRAPNYTRSEREILLNVILDYRHIIENKKTDGVSISEKKEAWVKIADVFNATSPNLVHREPDSLKKYYEHIKEDMRKKVGETKKELYKTGGGTVKVICTENTDDLLLSIMNSKTVYGLNNKFDCDMNVVSCDNQEALHTVAEVNNFSKDQIEIEYEENSDLENVVDCTKSRDTTLHIDSEKRQQTDIKQSENNSMQDGTTATSQKSSGCNWKKAKVDGLKTPKNRVLSENIQQVYSSKHQVRNHEVSRRRPTIIRTLTSSALGEKYEQSNNSIFL